MIARSLTVALLPAVEAIARRATANSPLLPLGRLVITRGSSATVRERVISSGQPGYIGRRAAGDFG
jgi:hypothetical protein